MSLERALQLNTTAMAVTGAVFLGLGHQHVAMPLVLAIGAVLALAVTDIWRWLLLNRWLANLIALAAVAWSLREFLAPPDSEQQLLAIANMLVCLQLVLLFQDKTPRLYWQLLVLSLLQVVVAAALSLGPQFGLVLAPYVLLALTQLVLLCMHRDLRSGEARPPAPDSKANWRTLLAPPAVSPGGMAAADLALAFRGWTVARHVALLAVATLLFTAVFFYATPRLNDSPWLGARGRGAVSGLATEVRLKQSGRIHLSDQVVMRALLTKLRDRSLVPLVGEPYFTGTTLSEYLTDDGANRWVAGPRRARPGPPQPRTGGSLPSLPAPPFSELVRQEIVLEVGSTPLCPAIMPVQPLSENQQRQTTRYVRSLNRLERTQEAEHEGREFRYTWSTVAIKSGRQARGMPHPNPLATMSDVELSSLVQFDAERFPRLAATAAAAIREQGAEGGTQLERALALERHFRATELYTYSLNLDMERNEELDPLEDFVANHRTGYCEYFAGALVLMLRSQGIPARMAIGYKGGELNSLGHYYVVKQRHAHAWVEAWMPPGDVAAWEIAGPASGGVWYRLDPTPGARETFTSAAEDTLARRLAHAFDYVDLLWRDYVLSLNRSRQEDTIYDPLTARATAIPPWMEARNVHRWLRRWSNRLGVDLVPPPGRGGPRAFEGSLALLVAGGLLLMVGVVQGAVFARRRLVRWWTSRRSAPAALAHPPRFYRRLEQLLAQLPLRRRPGQTPQELAAAAQQRLETAGTAPPVAQIPAEIVAEYYRVRFGAARLDKSQTAAIEQALHTLAPAVSQANPR
jgi:hypothetical protein